MRALNGKGCAKPIHNIYTEISRYFVNAYVVLSAATKTPCMLCLISHLPWVGLILSILLVALDGYI